jgi:hypothetical protein
MGRNYRDRIQDYKGEEKLYELIGQGICPNVEVN